MNAFIILFFVSFILFYFILDFYTPLLLRKIGDNFPFYYIFSITIDPPYIL